MVDYWAVEFETSDGETLVKDVRADTNTKQEAKEEVLNHGAFDAERILGVRKK